MMFRRVSTEVRPGRASMIAAPARPGTIVGLPNSADPSVSMSWGGSLRAVGRRRDLLIVGLFVALVGLLWLPRAHGPLDLRYDGGVYLLLGRALAEGKGYRLLNEPSEIAAVQYPPLLPLLVAAHWWAVGTDEIVVLGRWLRLTFFVLSVGYTVSVYALARRFLTSGYATLATFICTGHVFTLFLSDYLFAELPFALISVLFVLSATRRKRDSAQLLTVMLGIAAYLTRTAGLALLAAWVGESIVRRRGREAAYRACIAIVPIVLWQGYVQSVTASDAYRRPAYEYQRAAYQYYNVTYAENLLLVDPFQPELGRVTPGDLFRRMRASSSGLPQALGEAVSAPVGYWIWFVSSIERVTRLQIIPYQAVTLPLWIIGGAVAWGVVLLARRREWLLSGYIGLSLVLLCLTPWSSQFTRYLMPLAPFLAIALGVLLSHMSAQDRATTGPHGRRALSAARAAIVVAILVIVLYAAFRAYRDGHRAAAWPNQQGAEVQYSLFFFDDAWSSFDAALHWLSQDAEPTTIVGTAAPHYVFLRTGLQAVMPPYERDPEEAQRLLDAVPVTYLVIDALSFLDVSRRYGTPVVERYPERWVLEYAAEGSGHRIYRRREVISDGPR